MAAIRENEKLVLQSDWNYSLRQPGDAAWIGYRKPGSDSVFGELKCIAVSENGSPYVTASEGFCVECISKSDLCITYDDEGRRCSCRFLAPFRTFSSVHTARKTVSDIDVTSGGIGVSCDTNGQLNVWTTEDGTVRRKLEGHFGDVYACRFFPSGVVIISGGADTQLKIWSAENGHCAATLTGHRAGINDISIIERGRNFVSVSSDGTACLWDCGKQVCIATVAEGVGGPVNACSLGIPSNFVDMGEPDVAAGEREVGTKGKLLLIGVENGTLQGYGLHSRKQIFEMQCSSAVNCCTFLSDRQVACGTQDGQVYIVDLRNTEVPLQIIKEKRSAILSLLPSHLGLFMSTGDGSCIHLNENYTSSIELTGPDCDPVHRVATDGTFFYTGCRDGSIRKYKLSS